MSVKSIVFSAALALSAVASAAQASVITFEGTTPGLLVFGGGSEGGFDYEVQTGALFMNSQGNPGRDLEGDYTLGGGVVDFYASDLSLFTFDAIDYAAYDQSGTGTQTLTIRGYLNGNELAVDTFDLANTSTFWPSYPNWKTFTSVNLAGLSIDTLSVELNAGDESYFQAIDNVNLTSAVPEPATWAMMITGFGLAGAMLRRRRSLAFA